MQGLYRAHHALHALPQGGHWAFCYVITDLRIYPPPSPSHAPTRSRASTNQVTAGYEHIFYERRLDHESILSRSGLWAKILGEEPLFSCMGLSFEERFGNVAVLATVASSRNSEDALRECEG